GGDCIALYAHIKGIGMYKAAKDLQEHFGTPTAERTAPQKSESKPAPKKEREFDTAAFVQRLTYSNEVKALGIREEDAAALGIGFHSAAGMMRGKVRFPIRNEDGSIAGFIGFGDGTLKMPPRW